MGFLVVGVLEAPRTKQSAKPLEPVKRWNQPTAAPWPETEPQQPIWEARYVVSEMPKPENDLLVQPRPEAPDGLLKKTRATRMSRLLEMERQECAGAEGHAEAAVPFIPNEETLKDELTPASSRIRLTVGKRME